MAERQETRWTVELYETSAGRVPVQIYRRKLRRQAEVIRAIDREVERLQLFGFQQGRDNVKRITGWDPLWEIRARSARILAYERPRNVIGLLHAFTKNYGGRIRKSELQTGMRRLRDWEGRTE